MRRIHYSRGDLTNIAGRIKSLLNRARICKHPSLQLRVRHPSTDAYCRLLFIDTYLVSVFFQVLVVLVNFIVIAFA